MATFTHVGIGIVRTRPCFPTRSTMHHRLSRCWMCLSVSEATSDRRSPQPSRMASIARSRRPFFVVTSGVFRSLWACWTDSQFPTRTPTDLAPFTRVMPAASSGASNPLSAASTANFRTAVMRTLIETDPRPRASRATRQALTVAFVKPARGSRPDHANNSSTPRLYTRLVIGEETLSRTRALSLRQSATLFANANSFISVPLLGHIGSHLDLTSAAARAASARRELSPHSPIAGSCRGFFPSDGVLAEDRRYPSPKDVHRQPFVNSSWSPPACKSDE